MLLLLLAIPNGSTPIGTPDKQHYEEGKATYYGPGTMEGVAAKRGIKLNGASGFSSFPDCREIGNTLMVSVRDPRTGRWSKWESKRIVDCSQPRDYSRHVREGLVELSYRDAVKYGYAYDGRTRIRFYRR